MPAEGGGPSANGRAPGEVAAQQLAALIGPIRFASRDRFAGLGRLAAFEEFLCGAVARARTAGAPESPALLGLVDAAGGFDGLPAEQKKRALVRIAEHLACLIPVPDELRTLASRARVAEQAAGRPEPPSPTATPSPPVPVPAPAPAPDPNPDAAQRAARRARLAARLQDLARIHPAPRSVLEERGYLTVEQALAFWPKEYQDRTVVRRMAELRPGTEGIVLGQVRATRSARMRNRKPILKIELSEGSARLDLTFFNPPPWRLKQFTQGETLLVSGRVTEGFGGRLQMVQPEVEKLQPGDSANFGRIVPAYAGPADHQHPALRKLMKRLCDEEAPFAVDDLPAEIRERRRLLSIGTALQQAHFPARDTSTLHARERAIPAFRRLIYEEFFFLQLALARRRQGLRAESGIAFDVGDERIAEVVALLPFRLTGSQERALREIAGDMGRVEPMNRLLQGDVGSGKTAVAFAAMMLAVRSGHQAVLMAPTEILAEQHARTIGAWLAGTDVEVATVGSASRGRAQRVAREALASGRARIGIGTHALIEEPVALDRLGLVVVDEQHRFGVLQRAKLIAKGVRPDVLVMTATPIPRTLALAFYGDLDESKISELPPGRSPIETRVFPDTQRSKAHAIVRRELEGGRQAFVVYPLVAESEKSDLADATSGAADLARVFAGYTVGLLHGQMKAAEKEAIMARFRAGEIALLVATTVVEVGMDVPNATVILIEHAERFGLSQLHQLRGRVGRGVGQGRCLLVAHLGRAGDQARQRLRVMEQTQDGFEIARSDLLLRGPGELLGTRQAGQKLFDIADLYRDEQILEEARSDAFALVREDPELVRPEHAATREALLARWENRLSLVKVG